MGYKTMDSVSFGPHVSMYTIPVQELIELVNGNRSAIIVKKFLNDEVCGKICDNFSVYEKSKLRNDKVPGNYIGSYHYNKAMDHYLNEVELSRENIDMLFADTEDPMLKLQEHLKGLFADHGIACRVAAYKDRPAGRVVARKWTDKGQYSLKPHDDVAQLTFREQREFEIQEVKKYTIVGTNICVNNSEANGGELIVWNCMTDDQERETLNISETGYPYPLDYLSGFEKNVLKIERGDLYFLNSNLVHAVNNQKNNERLTISFFLGKKSEDTIIYWT